MNTHISDTDGNLENDNRELDFMEMSAKKIADDIYAKAIDTGPIVISGQLAMMAETEENLHRREVLLIAATQLLEVDFFRKRMKT